MESEKHTKASALPIGMPGRSSCQPRDSSVSGMTTSQVSATVAVSQPSPLLARCPLARCDQAREHLTSSPNCWSHHTLRPLAARPARCPWPPLQSACSGRRRNHQTKPAGVERRIPTPPCAPNSRPDLAAPPRPHPCTPTGAQYSLAAARCLMAELPHTLSARSELAAAPASNGCGTRKASSQEPPRGDG